MLPENRSPVRRLAAPVVAAAALALVGGTAAAAVAPATASAAASSTVVQGERFALTAGAGQAVGDAAAAAGSSLLIWSNGTATATFTTPVRSSAVAAVVKGDQCGGAPSMTVRVDGAVVTTRTVPQTTWTTARVAGSWAAGTHTVSVAFTNDTRTATCDRNLRLDQVALEPDTTATVPTATSGNPLAGAKLWVDPASQARQEMAVRAGDTAAVTALRKIADTPNAEWFGDWTPTTGLQDLVTRRTSQAAAAGAVPVLVTYAIPGRDCGSYSAGGLSGPAAYGAWVRAFTAGLGSRKAVVVVEPDALGLLDCLGATARSERMAMLRDALTVLRTAPGAIVYLDAGNSGWIPADVMAARLREAGVASARGFSLNVSNFKWTTDEVAFGDRLSALLGGAHYVVDTSRNGLGPVAGDLGWCNPAGRALGVQPTTATASAAADAYLWVKTVGQSDGECGRGEPRAGTWWPEYAIGLGSRAAY